MTSSISLSPSQKPAPVGSLASKCFGVALGLVIALLGCLFVWLLGRSFLRAWEMRSWPETKCVILVSEIEERRHDEYSPAEFRQNLSYGYEWAEQSLVGSKVTLRENPWSSKRELAEQRVEEFPAGMITNCRINPAKPEIAVLKVDSLAPGYSIWFPSLFVIGGLGIAVRTIRRG